MTLYRAVICALLFACYGGVFADDAAGGFVGSASCAECHAAETTAWRGSHHDLAMTEVGADTVLGDFDDARFTAHGVTTRFYRRDGHYYVHTDGPDGRLGEYRIRYTFGWYPLQQYLVDFRDGRLQALGIAWDSRPADAGGQRWFHLYPDEPMDHRHPLHWTAADQTWNYQCAECHSTRLEKNYDVASDRYATSWSEIDVACEACHGPGAAHLAWARLADDDPDKVAATDKGLVVDLADRDGGVWTVDPDTGQPERSVPRTEHRELELCARCHSRRGQIWTDYRHGRPLGDTHRLSLLDQALYFPDGQIKDEVYVYGSFLQSRMYAAGVTCSDCHEPHSLQLRVDGNGVCAQCHVAARYDTPEHHRHAQGGAGSACVDCHMPQRVYMVNDWRADHSMRVPRPDLSDRLRTPNACNACHVDRSNSWAAEAVAGWFPDSIHRGPHFGEALHAADRGEAGADDALLAIAADPSQPAIVRASAVARMRTLSGPARAFTLQRLVADPDPLLRRSTARLLESADMRTRVDRLWPLLSDPDRSVRVEAARVLAPLLAQRVPDRFREPLTAAVEAYAESEFVNADRAESHLNLGLIAVATGDARQAERSYLQSLRLDPGFTPAYVNLADLYRETGRDEDGEALLRAGLDRLGDNADLHHALGLLLVRRQRLDDAIGHLQRAAELAPGPRYALVHGLALQRGGRTELALAVIEAAARDYPGDRDLQLTLVTLYRDSGDVERARAHAGRISERFPGDRQIQALLRSLPAE